MDDYDRINDFVNRIINNAYHELKITDQGEGIPIDPELFNKVLVIVDPGLNTLIRLLTNINIPCSHCYEKYREIKSRIPNKRQMLTYILQNFGVSGKRVEDDYFNYNYFGCSPFDRDIKYLKKK